MLGFRWTQEWLEPPAAAMSHTSVVLPRDGTIVVGACAKPALLVRDRHGTVVRNVPVAGVRELHGITLVVEDGEERLWIADMAAKAYGGGPELELRESPTGQVLQIDMAGRRQRVLAPPDLHEYRSCRYQPTRVAVDERRHGGSGDLWVADGYGASLVHRYRGDGGYVATIDGTTGAGRFDEPHDVMIDRRGDAPLLYVADRRNGRIQVFDLDGDYVRPVGESELQGPTQMTTIGDVLLVTDLLAGRLSMFDADDHFVGHAFAHTSPPATWAAASAQDAWPNARDDDGAIARAPLMSGAFHTPHGIAAARDGTVYVSEFAMQGRITVLEPSAPDLGTT